MNIVIVFVPVRHLYGRGSAGLIERGGGVITKYDRQREGGLMREGDLINREGRGAYYTT